ncbi:hypothetical protein DRO91_03430 [Candidatus Heimdallarchaeota archaeon]|nr:MAG: hypothetical protein DRP02_05525 [Candidatus Gerdarchaeota archaeon]RLI73202.1 MAG: hypothetical protein DRO91_03430 [Candidatus Heimdallarchaeota archaeon]
MLQLDALLLWKDFLNNLFSEEKECSQKKVKEVRGAEVKPLSQFKQVFGCSVNQNNATVRYMTKQTQTYILCYYLSSNLFKRIRKTTQYI